MTLEQSLAKLNDAHRRESDLRELKRLLIKYDVVIVQKSWPEPLPS